MKKICGALVIGLSITTISTSYVFAKDGKKEAYCEELNAKSFILRSGAKLTEDQCRILSKDIKEISEEAFNDGVKHGLVIASQRQEQSKPFATKQKCPPCPSCDSFNNSSQNDLQRQQEIEDAERRGYYLNETQQLLKRR